MTSLHPTAPTLDPYSIASWREVDNPFFSYFYRPTDSTYTWYFEDVLSSGGLHDLLLRGTFTYGCLVDMPFVMPVFGSPDLDEPLGHLRPGDIFVVLLNCDVFSSDPSPSLTTTSLPNSFPSSTINTSLSQSDRSTSLGHYTEFAVIPILFRGEPVWLKIYAPDGRLAVVPWTRRCLPWREVEASSCSVSFVALDELPLYADALCAERADAATPDSAVGRVVEVAGLRARVEGGAWFHVLGLFGVPKVRMVTTFFNASDAQSLVVISPDGRLNEPPCVAEVVTPFELSAAQFESEVSHFLRTPQAAADWRRCFDPLTDSTYWLNRWTGEVSYALSELLRLGVWQLCFVEDETLSVFLSPDATDPFFFFNVGNFVVVQTRKPVVDVQHSVDGTHVVGVAAEAATDGKSAASGAQGFGLPSVARILIPPPESAWSSAQHGVYLDQSGWTNSPASTARLRPLTALPEGTKLVAIPPTTFHGHGSELERDFRLFRRPVQEKLAVYSHASTDSAVVGSLRFGEEVEFIEANASIPNLILVRRPGVQGWVSVVSSEGRPLLRLLRADDAPAPPVPPPVPVRVRPQPNAAEVPAGAGAPAVASQPMWLKWLAQRLATTSIGDYLQAVDVVTGRPYWWNKWTNERSFTRPAIDFASVFIEFELENINWSTLPKHSKSELQRKMADFMTRVLDDNSVRFDKVLVVGESVSRTSDADPPLEGINGRNEPHEDQELSKFTIKVRSATLSFVYLYEWLVYIDYIPRFRSEVVDVVYSLSNQADLLPGRREGRQVVFASCVTIRGVNDPHNEPADPVQPQPMSALELEFRNLRFCSSVTSIDAGFQSISAQMCKYIYEARSSLTQLQSLNLWRSGVSDVGALHLSKTFPYMPNLEYLVLDENAFTAAGASEIFLALKNPLHLFSIAKNYIGPPALRVFFRSTVVLTISHLILPECGCDDETAALLARRVLAQNVRNSQEVALRSIILGDHRPMGKPVADLWRKVVDGGGSISRVDLGEGEFITRSA